MDLEDLLCNLEQFIITETKIAYETQEIYRTLLPPQQHPSIHHQKV